MPGYTFSRTFEPLRNDSTIQTVLDTNALVSPIKTAIAGYIATLGLPAAETAHLSWENCGAEIYLEQLVMTYHLPSLGIQTPAPALKRSSTLADKVAEISSLNGQYPKCQLMIFVRDSASDPWVWKNTEVIQNYGNRANTLDIVPYLSQGTLDIFGKTTQIGIQFISDPVYKVTLPAAGDRLSIKAALRVEVSQLDSKKNDVIDQLRDRMAMLELAVNGRLIDLPANVLLGRNATTGTVETIAQSKFATPAMLDQAITDLVGGAPGALNTLVELAATLNNDANFAANVTNVLATKVSKTEDEQVDGNKIFNGFTTLGDTPLKVKIINATSPNSQGGYVQISHGVSSQKIIAILVMINWTGDAWIPNNYTFNPGRQFTWDIPDDFTLSIVNVANNSESIISKPARIFIAYTS
ncbi:hypothetical protein [Microcoleus sp. Pol17_C1]|uniref:hypothetical protein n=1 Tax=unclassified Microcoleus TaxID=2642155 RepID=UPI002FD0B0AF